MIFRPYYSYETGCAAYLFGCGGLGKAAVVDPLERDVESYLEFAAQKSMKITHVIETHIHADHRSGGRVLAERAGASYCLHASANVDFPFTALQDGDEIELGNTRIRVLHTPGHTDESLSLVVTDLRRGPEPWFVLTGDTLFTGAVGRPDLPGNAERQAELLHGSLQKLMALPDDLEVYPAHFLGSACGAGMSGKPSSTIAFERRFNSLLTLPAAAFVKVVVEVRAKPADMAGILAFNAGR